MKFFGIIIIGLVYVQWACAVPIANLGGLGSLTNGLPLRDVTGIVSGAVATASKLISINELTHTVNGVVRTASGTVSSASREIEQVLGELGVSQITSLATGAIGTVNGLLSL